ncbi:unnamed protein product [Closterium sp. NIES-65]|nr:unnamed protein product [Closterium sp. NIES-65]
MANSERGTSMGAGLPGMVPTPLFDGGVGQTHDMEAEHGESSPEEGVGDAGGDDPELIELTRLLNSVRQRRGRDISGILASTGCRGTPLLGADELEALASIDSSVRRHEECGKGPITGLNRGDTEAAASNIPRAAPIATNENPHAFTNDHPDPSPQPTSQPATPPQAVGHATAVAHCGRVNRGLYTNRLKKERDHLNNTNGGAPGPVPAAQPTRVGVHDQRKDTYRTRGAAYRGHGAGAAEGFQARGVKRERNVPHMTLIIDYDPERSGEGLIRGMPSADEIMFDYAMTNMRSKSMTLSQSPLTNEREMVEVLAEVVAAIKMWLAVAKGRLYVPEMGAFKRGEAGLFINESGFNEYLPEEYQVRPASHVGDEGPWME